MKKIIVRLITSNVVGWLIEQVTRNTIQFENAKFFVGYGEVSRYTKACLFWGLYEKQEARFILKYLPDTLPVIELGASLGVISCITAKKVFPQQVFSVEANPLLIPIIRNNLTLNNLTNCQVLNLGLGVSSTEQVFFTPGDDNTVGRITDEKFTNSVVVNCSSLSTLVSSIEGNRYNLICDIEGSEEIFLMDDSEALSGCECMIIELHDSAKNNRLVRIEDLVDRIQALGFSIIDRHGPVVVAKRN